MEKVDYEINTQTCAIMPVDEKNIKIIGEETFELKAKTNEIIEYGCRYYGSSFLGRVEGSKFLLGMRYKLPIILEEEKETILFPTHSYKNKACSWISLNKIKGYNVNTNGLEVLFHNNKSVVLPISLDSFESQMLRATKLLLNLRQRKKEM